VDYVCLLSESGDSFPDTGHTTQGKKSKKKKSKVEPKSTCTIKKKPNNVTLGSTLKERVLLKCFCLQVTGRVTFKQEHFKSRIGWFH
jgi:hypothetical protein